MELNIVKHTWNFIISILDRKLTSHNLFFPFSKTNFLSFFYFIVIVQSLSLFRIAICNWTQFSMLDDQSKMTTFCFFFAPYNFLGGIFYTFTRDSTSVECNIANCNLKKTENVILKLQKTDFSKKTALIIIDLSWHEWIPYQNLNRMTFECVWK